MADVLANKSREEIAEMAEKVIFPDTDRKETTFLGVSVSLRPLPLKWSKMLSRAFDKARKNFAEGAPDDAGADEETANAFLDAAAAVCDFYRIGKDRAAIEAEAGLPQIMVFCNEAAAICRDNDFLLWRLRGASEVIALTLLKRQADLMQMRKAIEQVLATETIPNGSSSPASLKPMEDLTESSSDTPTGN